MTVEYSKSLSSSPYVETFKGVDGYFAVDMSHLSTQQTESLRKLANDGQITQAGLSEILGDTQFISIDRLVDMWELPAELKAIAQGEDGEFNPTLMAMACFQMLQDTQQDLREVFMQYMFKMQDSMLNTADKQRADSFEAAAAGYSAAIFGAVAGIVGGAVQMAGAGSGMLNLTQVKGDLRKMKDLSNQHEKLQLEIKELGKPSEAEKIQAERVVKLQEKHDAETDPATKATIKAELDQATADYKTLQSQRHDQLEAARTALRANEREQQQLNGKMDRKNQWASALTTSARASEGLSSAIGIGKAGFDQIDKQEQANAQHLSVVGNTESQMFGVWNSAADASMSDIHSSGDAASAIVNSAASTNSAIASRMA